VPLAFRLPWLKLTLESPLSIDDARQATSREISDRNAWTVLFQRRSDSRMFRGTLRGDYFEIQNERPGRIQPLNKRPTRSPSSHAPIVTVQPTKDRSIHVPTTIGINGLSKVNRTIARAGVSVGLRSG
jgi:hypothetical protein